MFIMWSHYDMNFGVHRYFQFHKDCFDSAKKDQDEIDSIRKVEIKDKADLEFELNHASQADAC